MTEIICFITKTTDDLYTLYISINKILDKLDVKEVKIKPIYIKDKINYYILAEISMCNEIKDSLFAESVLKENEWKIIDNIKVD